MSSDLSYRGSIAVAVAAYLNRDSMDPAKLIQIEISLRAIISPLAWTLLTYFKSR
jgi:hypothetical protein